jgi:hypothetical protein
VKFRFIDDVEPSRTQFDHQFFAKSVRDGHLALLS